MKQRTIRFLSLFMVVLLLSLLCVPAFASSDFQYEQKTVPFWDWFIRLGGNWNIIGQFLGSVSGDICLKSDDGYHHANTIQEDRENGYYSCICSYCGQKFTAYESDFKQAYSDYTASLPATGYNSAGNLIWQPRTSDVTALTFYYNSATDSQKTIFNLSTCLPNSDHSGFVNYTTLSSSTPYRIIVVGITITGFPVSGVYRRMDTLAAVGSVINKSVNYNFSCSYEIGGFERCSPSSSLRITAKNTPDIPSSGSTYLSVEVFCPVYEVVPDSAISGDTYNTTTRPTTITGGNYGIVGDDGQITTVVDNSTIVNETNNIYYNPATGQKETINSWTYDYSDRSYNITLESGDTVTVTYGDENITIVEGDTYYIIYYIIQGDGSGSGSDNNCVHEWYQAGHKEGSCVLPEQRTYTCSKCGKQYTETDSVLGHSWHIIQTVSTKYDEDGTLIQEGYTVYECERCGEQYKATNDTGPPVENPDTVDDGGLLAWINSLIKFLSDNLSGAVDLILGFFRKIPEMFGGFLDFLSAMFPFLPDDIIFLLTFGMAAVVFVGIIKAIRR